MLESLAILQRLPPVMTASLCQLIDFASLSNLSNRKIRSFQHPFLDSLPIKLLSGTCANVSYTVDNGKGREQGRWR